MGIVYIYGLVDPRNDKIFYVGYSKNLKSRLNAHIRDKYNPLKDMIIEEILTHRLKPQMVVIDECKHVFNEDYNMYEHERLEIYYIKKYRESGINLTNLTDGGGDTGVQLKKRVYKYDQFGKFIEEYESISDASIDHNINSRNIGHAVDQKNKNTCSNHYWFSSKENAEKFKDKKEAENVLNIGRGIIGRVIKTRGKKSAAGYLWFYVGNEPETVKKYVKNNYREISQYDLDGNFLKCYPTIKKASEESNVCDVSIISCAKSKFSHAGGFLWKYGDDTNKIDNWKLIYYGISVLKYNLNDELICEYNSITDAAKHNNLTFDIVKSRLNSGKEINNSFIFKYKNK